MVNDDRPVTLTPTDECARLVIHIWPHMARLTPAEFCRYYLARIEYDE